MGTLYGAIDLHSTNCYCGVIDEKDQWVSHKRIKNDIEKVKSFFEPHKENLAGIAIESTYNGYWIIDGLKENGYKVRLGNPSQMGKYQDLKNQDDETDTRWLAKLLRLDILPEGYIYPKEKRPLRDLLRKRMLYLSARSKVLNSVSNQFETWLCRKPSKRDMMELSREELYKLFEEKNLCFAAVSGIEIIKTIDTQIDLIEKEIYKQVKKEEEVIRLQELPGIAHLLGMTIMLEVGTIDRFASDKNYLSFCRLVESKRSSNNKKKGKGNAKCGNKILRWAYAEAAISALKYPRIKAYYERLKKKKPAVKALAIIASKIARVSYKIMKDPNFCYQEEKLFC
ncbi:MAG: IS110 family transposase [Candidatus Omnitrophota bacterium]|nr:IS110 family transposase [Pseudomonadota bacterium]